MAPKRIQVISHHFDLGRERLWDETRRVRAGQGTGQGRMGRWAGGFCGFRGDWGLGIGEGVEEVGWVGLGEGEVRRGDYY